MKIFTESNWIQRDNIVKAESSDGPRFYIEGVFLQADIVNRNGRRYPSNIVESAVNTYQSAFIGPNKALGELEHPDHPHINYERACIKTVKLERDGSNWIGKALVLSTPTGKLIENLITDGVAFGVSSRALASSKNEGGVEVILEDLVYLAVDVVSDPSAPEAWVNSVLERKEYMIESGMITERLINKAVQERAVKSRDFKRIAEFLQKAIR